MADPISITGLVLAVISVIQGGRKIFSRLWNRLKAAFGGLRSQSSYNHIIIRLQISLESLTRVLQVP